MSRCIRALAALSVALTLPLVALAFPRKDLPGQILPEVRLRSVDNQEMSASIARGRYLLYVFTDAASRENLRAFLVENAGRIALARDFAMHVIDAPGLLYMPRAMFVTRAKDQAGALIAEARTGLMVSQTPGFDRAQIRWHVDFDRAWSNIFHAPAGDVSLLLADPTGRIMFVEDAADQAAVDRVFAAMREGRLATIPEKPLAGPPQKKGLDSAKAKRWLDGDRR